MRYSNRTILYDGIFAARTPEYSSWSNMMSRCKQNYAEAQYYKDKGIAVCKEWAETNGFLNFFRDMGKRPTSSHTLDRINPRLGYSPENCRWATKSQQAINRGLGERNKSGYRGVSWYRQTHKWRVGIDRITVGYFFNKEDAALAYDCAAIQLYGTDAKLNILEL